MVDVKSRRERMVWRVPPSSSSSRCNDRTALTSTYQGGGATGEATGGGDAGGDRGGATGGEGEGEFSVSYGVRLYTVVYIKV